MLKFRKTVRYVHLLRGVDQEPVGKWRLGQTRSDLYRSGSLTGRIISTDRTRIASDLVTSWISIEPFLLRGDAKETHVLTRPKRRYRPIPRSYRSVHAFLLKSCQRLVKGVPDPVERRFRRDDMQMRKEITARLVQSCVPKSRLGLRFTYSRNSRGAFSNIPDSSHCGLYRSDITNRM